MTYFITIEELKQTTFNANLDNEYIAPALEEAQSIYLREIIGDLLYNSIANKIDSETLSGKYLTLVNQYIKHYLTYKVQSVIVIPLNNKTRNAGVIQQYDQGFNTSTMKDTAYLAEYYNSRAEFYANRLTVYLQKNATSFPEYGYSDDNITQPTETQNVTTIYLGTGRKKCGCTPTKGGGGGGTADAVEWENILNKPQPTIGAGIVTLRQGDIEQSFDVNSTENLTIELSDGVTDYNELQNKPDLSVFAPKATVYTKTEIDALTGQINEQIGTKASQTSLDTHTGNGTIHVTASDKENWNGKTTMAAVEAKGYAVANNLATVATSGSYMDLSNKPAIPTVPTNVSAFNNDAGYLTQHQSLAGYATESWVQQQGYSTFDGNYNNLTNKPTIPSNETDLGLSSETWSFTLSDGTTVTKTVVIK